MMGEQAETPPSGYTLFDSQESSGISNIARADWPKLHKEKSPFALLYVAGDEGQEEAEFKASKKLGSNQMDNGSAGTAEDSRGAFDRSDADGQETSTGQYLGLNRVVGLSFKPTGMQR
ncbi:MAG: hypothetical protein Q9175_004630 [Cornicularia normoerica]